MGGEKSSPRISFIFEQTKNNGIKDINVGGVKKQIAFTSKQEAASQSQIEYISCTTSIIDEIKKGVVAVLNLPYVFVQTDV